MILSDSIFLTFFVGIFDCIFGGYDIIFMLFFQLGLIVSNKITNKNFDQTISKKAKKIEKISQNWPNTNIYEVKVF